MRSSSTLPHIVQRNIAAGFTLVELLVVVAIISTLTSILLPSLTRAQKQGERIHCLANQRQIVLAWHQYAIDEDDYLCVPDSFRRLLKPYVKTDEIFQCKSTKDNWHETRHKSYAISHAMGGTKASGARIHRDGVWPFTKMHQVSSPSGRLVCVDIRSGNGSPFWPIVLDANEWVWRPFTWPAYLGTQGMTDRHSNGCNLTFADGHGEVYHWRDNRTLQLIKGQIVDEIAASEANTDLEHMVTILMTSLRNE